MDTMQAGDTIRTGMPVLARHEGEWVGTYTHMDADHKIVDQHRSHLKCTFPADGPHAYHQINRYMWTDGREEEHHFPAAYRNGRILWDTDRISGYAWELDARTVALTWTRKDMPGWYLYEMIQISEDNTNRARTWHWFENDILVRRTLIQEKRVG